MEGHGSAPITAPRSKKAIWLNLSGLLVINILIALDTTCLATALPTIALKLNATDTEAYWAGTAFVVCSAVFQPIFGSLSGAFGRKPSIFGAIFMFTLGSIVCAVAHNIATLIAGRCLQGIGGGGLLVLTYVILADLFALAERAKYQSIVSLTWLVGAVVGPIMAGGFASSKATWRWIFWFNLPFCGISFLCILFFLHIPYTPTSSSKSRLLHYDWFGSFLFATSLTILLMSLSWGGVMFRWASYKTLLPLILGIVGLIAWALYSQFVAKNPMIPLRILSDRTAAIHYYGNFIQGFCQLIMIYYLPLYYQGAHGYSPLISGVALLPQCFLTGPSSAISGILVNKTRVIKVYVLFGWAMLAFGLGLIEILDVHTSVAAWIFINIPSGLGLGVLFSTLAMATQTATEQRPGSNSEQIAPLKSAAAGLNPFFRALGQSIGIVIGQTAFTNHMKSKLGEQAANQAAALAQRVGSFPAAEQVVIRNAFVDSLRIVWWIGVGLALSALVVTLFAANHRIAPLAVLDEESKDTKTSNSTVSENGADPEAIPLSDQVGVNATSKE